MKKTMSLILLCVVSMQSNATNCKRIGHSEGKVHEIEAEAFNYTHIILPENTMQKTNPILGNPDLWTADKAGPHIYIKPNSTTAQGRSTSYSVVGESGASYDFKVVRRQHIHNPCYKVADGVLFSKEERKALSKPVQSASSEVAGLWKEKYLQQKKKSEYEKQQAILKALRLYRYQIYTRYDWNRSSRSFIGNDFISDVYDDGRFTYVRVNKQNRGIMMIEATLDGQTELIEAKYDTLNKMYTVSGIFPQFTMKYGNSKVKVQRDNNETVGEY